MFTNGNEVHAERAEVLDEIDARPDFLRVCSHANKGTPPIPRELLFPFSICVAGPAVERGKRKGQSRTKRDERETHRGHLADTVHPQRFDPRGESPGAGKEGEEDPREEREGPAARLADHPLNRDITEDPSKRDDPPVSATVSFQTTAAAWTLARGFRQDPLESRNVRLDGIRARNYDLVHKAGPFKYMQAFAGSLVFWASLSSSAIREKISRSRTSLNHRCLNLHNGSLQKATTTPILIRLLLKKAHSVPRPTYRNFAPDSVVSRYPSIRTPECRNPPLSCALLSTSPRRGKVKRLFSFLIYLKAP